jgi:hypothetical protein
MGQNFVYPSEIAAQTIREIGLKGIPDMGWRELVFNRVFFFNNLMRKANYEADVMYVVPFSGKVPLDSADPNNNLGIFGQFQEDYSSDFVDASGFRVYAVDSALKVRRWAKKVVLGQKNADGLCTNFAREVVEKYGKVAILDSPSSTSEKGLFSVYFPFEGSGFLASTILKEDEVSFEKDLTSLLERIQRQN